MKEKMKTSKVFEEAAELIEVGIKTTCCDAIGAAQDVHYTVETESKRLFIDLFKPPQAFECDCWMGDTSCPDAKEHRIWAMLFMAEITKTRRVKTK